MTERLGVLVFARYDSTRLPGKALRLVGGIPLLERVIRRAQLLEWPVYLATTQKRSDDALVELADGLGVSAFRGSEEHVLERAVLAAEDFGLDGFARLCGDRPLFPVDSLHTALQTMRQQVGVDLVTDNLTGAAVRGLTTEVVRTVTLRQILDGGASAAEQEHVTPSFYQRPDEFNIAALPLIAGRYACPGFAVDTDADVANLDRIFGVCPAIELTVAAADRIFRS